MNLNIIHRYEESICYLEKARDLNPYDLAFSRTVLYELDQARKKALNMIKNGNIRDFSREFISAISKRFG